MNINKNVVTNHQFLRIPHTDPLYKQTMTEHLISWFPRIPREYVIVCIGTDRSTGDSLGPLTGSFLTKLKPKHMTVYGTLHQPVHAQNLHEYIEIINKKHHNPFIIAVDACLGRTRSIGNLIAGVGSLKPGEALKKVLPSIGDIYITGVVNVNGFMQYAILQNTRLAIVNDMATCIASILIHIDQLLTHDRSLPASVKQNVDQHNILFH